MSEIALHDRPGSSAGPGRWAGIAALAAVTLGVGVWALWPLGPAHAVADAAVPNVGRAGAASPVPHALDLNKPLDLAAFRTPLWVSPPPPPAPPQPPPPPPPLKLQLIAIIEGGTGHGALAPTPRSALIYDPDQDKLLSLTEGQSVQGRTVERISATGVELKDQHGTRSLSLKNDPPREAGGGAGVATATGSTKTAATPLVKTTPLTQLPAAAVPPPAPATESPEKGDTPGPEKKDPAPDPSSAPAPTPTPAPSPPPDPGGTP